MTEHDLQAIELPLWFHVAFFGTAVLAALLMVYIPIFIKAGRFQRGVRKHFADLPTGEVESLIHALRWPILRMTTRFMNRGGGFASAQQELSDIIVKENDPVRAARRAQPALLRYLWNWTDRFLPPPDTAEESRYAREQRERVLAVATPLRQLLKERALKNEESGDGPALSELQERMGLLWKEWLDVRHLPSSVHKALFEVRSL